MKNNIASLLHQKQQHENKKINRLHPSAQGLK
jgi:hypothetical protein